MEISTNFGDAGDAGELDDLYTPKVHGSMMLWSPSSDSKWNDGHDFPANNETDQLSEREIMKSMFEGWVHDVDEVTYEIAISISMHETISVRISSDVTVDADADSDAVEQEDNKKSDGEDAQQQQQIPEDLLDDLTIQVQYLPPIILNIRYHEDYPSKHPPFFTLRAPWLNPIALSSIALKLDEIAKTYPETSIVHFWADFLLSESWEFMTSNGLVSNPFYLDAMNRKNAPSLSQFPLKSLDARVKFCIEDPKETFAFVFEFDRMKRRDLFLQENHTCIICFDEKPGTEFVHLEVCDHTICRDCLCQFVSSCVKDGAMKMVRCPETECKQRLLPQTVRMLLEKDDEYERYERLLLEQSLMEMGDVRFCPREDCGRPVVVDAKSDMGLCATCGFSFCRECGQAYHGNVHCMSQVLNLNKKRERLMREAKAASNENVSSKKRVELRALDAEMKTLATLNSERNVTRCPGCNRYVMKTGGCNHMICGFCQRHWCWKCMKIINGYDHFGSASCQLFTDDNNVAAAFVRNPVNRAPAPEVAAMMRAVGANKNPDRVTACPRCKLRVLKADPNNHLVCPGCATQFCFTCHEVVHGTKHFVVAGDGCRQHTPV